MIKKYAFLFIMTLSCVQQIHADTPAKVINLFATSISRGVVVGAACGAFLNTKNILTINNKQPNEKEKIIKKTEIDMIRGICIGGYIGLFLMAAVYAVK